MKNSVLMVAGLLSLSGVGCTYNYYMSEGAGGDDGGSTTMGATSSSIGSSSAMTSSSASSSGSGGAGGSAPSSAVSCFPLTWIDTAQTADAPCVQQGGTLMVCFDGPGGTSDPRLPLEPQNCYGLPWNTNVSMAHASLSCCKP